MSQIGIDALGYEVYLAKKFEILLIIQNSYLISSKYKI